ncbi:MAG: type II toxin-antitoxin system Phd/YefM family antitoxin [Acidobacteriia bacterium]|nr:type II toxin-antitoxin system Phd/YefM family antitoxin [Terriglobia bacterium]
MSKTRKNPSRVAKAASAAKTRGPAWQIQTAKARFSEVFRRARTEGPQRITRQGKEGVVMISDEQFDRLMAKSRQPKSIVQFFRESPLAGVHLDLERDRDIGRDIEL